MKRHHLFPKAHTTHPKRLKLNPAQKRLLHNSQSERSTLFKRNEQGNPIEGTYSKCVERWKQIADSDLPHGVKLRERDKWGLTMANHLIFRKKQANAKKKLIAQGIKREPTVEEISRESIADELQIFSKVMSDLKQYYGL